MESFEGKVAAVTGGASGIGKAMANRFGAAGMRVVVADIEKEALDEAVAELEAAGVEAIGVPTDVSDGTAVEALRDAALDRFGAIHVACNNAGVATGGKVWEQTVDDWQWVLGVNLWGVIHGVRAFVPVMLRQGEGHVVNTASMAGLTSPPFMGIYNVTKHAVVTLSETLHGELTMEGGAVGVSVLCPGWVKTRIADASRNRPGQTALAGAVEEGGEAMIRDVLNNFISTGLDPAQVAEEVFEAVRDRRFYVLTHRDWKPMISNRVDNIVNERDPQLAMLPEV
jgi:NAD(P)-dependent dehydrogenase (short-subunit alcohol dehydrogenase family)